MRDVYDRKASGFQSVFLYWLIDCTVIVALLVACFWVYHGIGTWAHGYTPMVVGAILLFSLAAYVNQVYDKRLPGGLKEDFQPILKSWFVVIMGLLLVGYAFKTTHQMSRLILGFWSILTPVGLLSWRAAVLITERHLYGPRHNSRKAVIVGVNDSSIALARNILDRPWTRLDLVGFISETQSGEITVGPKEGNAGSAVAVLGPHQRLFEMADANEVEVVYIAYSTQEKSVMDRVIQRLGDTTVSIFLVPDKQSSRLLRYEWTSIGDMQVATVIDNPNQGYNSWIKRSEDLLIATLALVALAVPMVLIAFGIKIGSRGPVIYKQRRYGINGRSIEVWKFRSMTVTDSDAEFVPARKNDTRVTSFGAFLRKTSLDELPQLFNVLKGDMSIVGPRPHAASENEEFRKRIDGYMLRHKVKPGITGLAQVNGFRGETATVDSMRQRVHYDVEYIRNWSLWLDLMIIAKTPFCLINE